MKGIRGAVGQPPRVTSWPWSQSKRPVTAWGANRPRGAARHGRRSARGPGAGGSWWRCPPPPARCGRCAGGAARHRWQARRRVSGSAASAATRLQASSSAMLAPCARKGSVGCAASPRSASWPSVQTGATGWRKRPQRCTVSTRSRRVADLGAEIHEGAAQVLRVVGMVPALGGPGVAFLHRHDVDEPAPPQRVAHQVAARAHEDMRLRRQGTVIGDRGAPGDLAGEEGAGPGVERGARGRVDAVGGEGEAVAFGRGLGEGQQRLGPLDRHRLDPVFRRMTTPASRAGAGEDVDQVGPMDGVEGRSGGSAASRRPPPPGGNRAAARR
jgi:hypothetical protein